MIVGLNVILTGVYETQTYSHHSSVPAIVADVVDIAITGIVV
jgi:hypothetical protein